MYKPLRATKEIAGEIVNGWRLYSIGLFKRPIDGNPFYPSRQNAYARSKQLNTIGDPMDFIATFRVTCHRNAVSAFQVSCRDLFEQVQRHLMIVVLDEGCYVGKSNLIPTPNERQLLFCVDTKAEDPANDPLREPWMLAVEALSNDQLDTLLGCIKAMEGVSEAVYSFDDIKFC